MLFEGKVKVEDASVKDALEAVPLGHLPLFIDDLEGDVLVGWPCTKTDDERVGGVRTLQVVLRRFGLVEEVRVEDVKFVALDCLWRRVVEVIVGLVVLVPLITGLNSVEEARLPRPVLVLPMVLLDCGSLSRGICAEKDVSELFFILSNTFPLELLIHVE